MLDTLYLINLRVDPSTFLLIYNILLIRITFYTPLTFFNDYRLVLAVDRFSGGKRQRLTRNSHRRQERDTVEPS